MSDLSFLDSDYSLDAYAKKMNALESSGGLPSGIGSDFLAGQSQLPGLSIAPSFSNVYTPSQTATGGSISIGIPTGETYAPAGTTGSGTAEDYMPIIYMVLILAVVMFAVWMFMKKGKK